MSLGFESIGRLRRHALEGPEHVIARQPLRTVLAFTGRSIDEVVNNPIVKNEVLGYYRLYKWINRELEISDLERQWNP